MLFLENFLSKFTKFTTNLFVNKTKVTSLSSHHHHYPKQIKCFICQSGEVLTGPVLFELGPFYMCLFVTQSEHSGNPSRVGDIMKFLNN